jgi:hypothetical protein
MAAITGFGEFSISPMISGRLGGCDGLLNSVMSAPGDEGATRAHEHDRARGRVVARLRQRAQQAGAHHLLERVDRRIVDGDDGDLTVLL